MDLQTPKVMAATLSDKKKEVLSLKDFERALLLHRRLLSGGVFEQPAKPSHLEKTDFKKSLNQLVSLNKEKRISDEDFENLVYLICAAYIEQVVETKVREIIDGKFYDVFHSKLSANKLIELLS